ncbi:SIKE1 protein, partial [Phainopepla nitens]|nr:SIKE1 protein [Phainopepla nitens]
IDKILTDARTLLERLKEHDTAAESLIDQSAVLHRRVAAMREAGAGCAEQSDPSGGPTAVPGRGAVGQLGAPAAAAGRGRDVLCSAELWVSLEEHQDALELIMSKYRKQMLQLLEGRKREETEPVLKVHQANSGEIESQIDRICEMGDVMRKAVQMDDEQFFKVQEKLAQLELENKELRELLSISRESFEVGREDLPD